jgi:hypothetical protein
MVVNRQGGSLSCKHPFYFYLRRWGIDAGLQDFSQSFSPQDSGGETANACLDDIHHFIVTLAERVRRNGASLKGVTEQVYVQ